MVMSPLFRTLCVTLTRLTEVPETLVLRVMFLLISRPTVLMDLPHGIPGLGWRKHSRLTALMLSVSVSLPLC